MLELRILSNSELSKSESLNILTLVNLRSDIMKKKSEIRTGVSDIADCNKKQINHLFF